VSSLLVRADGLSRTYGEGLGAIRALTNADFEIRTGDRIALVGPSGSGKSTVLHLIAGIDEPTGGVIDWPGLGSVEALRPGPVALAFQGPSLLPPLDVVENVALPIILAGGSEHEARRRSQELLDRFELADVAARLPEELSGGQLQRAGLARALAGRPTLLLADEPTGQQDRAGGERLMDVVLACLNEVAEGALVTATHDRLVAGRMAMQWKIEGGTLDAGARQR
jgi:predicted ABC-type transport system involved in lysophospholipase L1 biosynthesis ATPase subunit